jgi:nucleotide-binding universal stress UspA family protein
MSEQHRIVVGVDGSESSKAALAWAVRQAECTDASVEALIAWEHPIAFAGMPFAPIGAMAIPDFEKNARNVLAAAISETIDPSSPVKVSATAREGNAPRVLLDVADGADLLVVGSRGHGGFTEALLGSVSQHCVHHAPCPVVIVRGARRSSSAPGEGELR